jgi:hypothetical protein
VKRIKATVWAAGVMLAMAVAARAEGAEKFAEVAGQHPAAAELKGLFKAGTAGEFVPTKLTRKDYLPLIAGNVDFWKHFQSAEGAIVDPYEKKERQYSTPAFALAGALLVKEAGRKDLLEPSVKAFEFSLNALLNKTTADQHADFYIPMLMHARRILGSVAERSAWRGGTRSFGRSCRRRCIATRGVGGIGTW